jgi:voltage-gated sodium channel
VEADAVFLMADNIFCLYFLLELCIRFAAFARKVDCLVDAWFGFDAVLAILQILDTWVFALLLVLSSGGKSGIIGNMSVLRVIRLLRVAKMVRVARLLRTVPEFVILVKGMVAAMRSFFFTLSLLVIFLYVFAIFLREMTCESKVGDTYFPKVPAAMLSLLTRCTFF